MTATISESEGPPVVTAPAANPRRRRPILSMLWRRAVQGLLSVAVVAVIVYFATLVLPGDAATAILGNQATPARVAQLRHQLGLDRPVLQSFWSWLTGLFQGDFGRSLTEDRPVWSVVSPRLANSVVLGRARLGGIDRDRGGSRRHRGGSSGQGP